MSSAKIKFTHGAGNNPFAYLPILLASSKMKAPQNGAFI